MIHSAVFADDVRPVGHANGDGLSRHDAIALRLPPHDPDAELSVVASELAKPGIVDASGLVPADFYSAHARGLLDVIEALKAARAPLSVSTIRSFLQKPEQAELFSSLGGQPFIEQVDAFSADVVLFDHYAGIVKAHARRRRLKERALSIASATDDLSIDLDTLLSARADFDDLHLPAPHSFTLRTLSENHPTLAEPVVDGLIRRGEVANVIAPSKIGKSWLAYLLALSIIVGRDWFGFPTRSGRVLLIDNELHKATLAHRLQRVGEAMGLRFNDYADLLTVWPFRGKGMDVLAIGRKLNRIPPRFYSAIILDAKYRALVPGTSENSNEAEAAFYNEQDSWGERLESSIVNIHHSTKGDQSDKRVTDVGAGGGAQSRAADTHVILREHEENGAFVLDAAVRSFKPVEPIGLRWEFPLWHSDSDVNPALLKRHKSSHEEKQVGNDAEADQLFLDACVTWRTVPEIRRATGLGACRTERALGRLLIAKLIEEGTEDRFRNPGSQVFRKTIHAK